VRVSKDSPARVNLNKEQKKDPMKMNKLITTAVLALASAALLEGSAMAQTFNTGDLILGFRLNSGTGTSGTNLEIDLGSASTFNFATSHSVAGLNVSDLTSLYTASWNSNANLVWSVAAATDASSNILFLSDPSNASTVIPIKSTSGDATSIRGLYSEQGSPQGSNASSFDVAPTDASSYASIIRNVNGGSQFSTDYNFVPFETEQGVSSSGTSIDLYELVPAIGKGANNQTATDLGTFTVNGNGTLDFTAAAVPEPSTYALFGFSALALLMMSRRLNRA
jgi:hypothetical protein